MSLDTITLQCFLSIAETKSFTKAALRVGRTQSAISQQIAKLEQLLEKRLIVRGRSVHLTPDGEVFLGYAKRMYELYCESIDRFKVPDLQGELTCGLPEDFATMILSDVLVEFARLHPRVLLSVECDLTLNLLARFQRGQFDMILVKTNEHALGDGQVTVWQEPVDWVGKKELLPGIDERTILPLVLSPAPCVYRDNVIASLEKQHLKWRLAFSSPSYAGKMAAVRAGLGITAIQRSMIPNYLDRLDLEFLPDLNRMNIVLLKRVAENHAVASMEYFIKNKLKQ